MPGGRLEVLLTCWRSYRELESSLSVVGGAARVAREYRCRITELLLVHFGNSQAKPRQESRDKARPRDISLRDSLTIQHRGVVIGSSKRFDGVDRSAEFLTLATKKANNLQPVHVVHLEVTGIVLVVKL